MANNNNNGKKKSQKQINTEIQLKTLLGPIYNPKEGKPIDEITKTFFPSWRFMQPDQFRKESKFIERTLGSIRHEVYMAFSQQVIEAQEGEYPKVAVASIPPPDFLPFALKRDQIYWCYFNCVRKPYTDDVEKILRSKADGLIRAADIMDEMFNPTIGGP